MRRIVLAFAASLSLSACMTTANEGTPLVGDALEQRLSGQQLAMDAEISRSTPTLAKLYPDGQVELSYGDTSVERFRWRVEGQGLCFSGRLGASDQFFCRNVLAYADSNAVKIFDATGADAQLIATGTLRPL